LFNMCSIGERTTGNVGWAIAHGAELHSPPTFDLAHGSEVHPVKLGQVFESVSFVDSELPHEV
jgi:hypothetical protein